MIFSIGINKKSFKISLFYKLTYLFNGTIYIKNNKLKIIAGISINKIYLF